MLHLYRMRSALRLHHPHRHSRQLTLVFLRLFLLLCLMAGSPPVAQAAPPVPSLVGDINRNTIGSNPKGLTAVGNVLYLSAVDGPDLGDRSERELWRYDGVTTTKIDINPTGPSRPNWLTAVGNMLYFSADDGTGAELWRYDGVTPTKIDINPTGGSDPAGLTVAKYALYFSAWGQGVGRELWTLPLGAPPAQPASITVLAGNGQSAPLRTTFPIPLQAMVTDDTGHRLPNVMVTFTAPLSGAGGTFLGGVTMVVTQTNAGGVAIAPPFTANGTPGNYTVLAQATGVILPAKFALSNLEKNASNWLYLPIVVKERQ